MIPRGKNAHKFFACRDIDKRAKNVVTFTTPAPMFCTSAGACALLILAADKVPGRQAARKPNHLAPTSLPFSSQSKTNLIPSMFHLSEPEIAAIERNHTRLAKIGDRGRTANLFAELDAEAARAEAQAAQARHEAEAAARERAYALRATGADLPLFANA